MVCLTYLFSFIKSYQEGGSRRAMGIYFYRLRTR